MRKKPGILLRKLGAWEYGLLDDEDRREFERHLIEDQGAFNEAADFLEVSEMLRDPSRRAAYMAALDSRDVPLFFGIRALAWSAVVILLAVAVAIIISIRPGQPQEDAKMFAEEETPAASKELEITNLRSLKSDGTSLLNQTLEELRKRGTGIEGLTVRFVVNRTGTPPLYQVGDRLKIGLKVNKDCYFYVLDLQPDGRLSMLYPGGGYSNNLARAGLPFLIPPEEGVALIVAEPTGIERLLLSVSIGPLDLEGMKEDEAIFEMLRRVVTEVEFLIEE